MRNDIEWIASEKPTNIEQIKAFEAKCGYKFPKSYIDLVLKYNGAEIFNYIACFHTYYENGEIYDAGFGIGSFLAFGKENVSYETSLIDWFWENRNSDESYPFPQYLVPIIFDGGGNYVCFDYRHDPKTDNPRVVFWFHEGIAEDGNEIFKIANSFDEFLDCLFDNRSEKRKAEDVISRKEYLEIFGDK